MNYGPPELDTLTAVRYSDARFQLKEFDKLYEKSLTIPDSPERNAIYREMNRLIIAYAPWRLGVHRIFNHGATALRSKRVLVTPEHIRPGELRVDKTVWRIPSCDFRSPAHRDTVNA